MTLITWAFLDRQQDVEMLSEDVAYSWKCGSETHKHVIECLWIWHNCDANLSSAERDFRDEGGRKIYVGWTPTGVAAHDLISELPLHIEASIYWPECCGMHGFIRDGKYLAV